MNVADILHDTAMDYYDLGKIAKAKGKHTVYEDYLNKAYILDKEAAIKKYQDTTDNFWKYVYLRSAAWLAIDCNKPEEAEILARFGLQDTPPALEKAEFLEILKKISKGKKEKDIPNSNVIQFLGVLTSADTSSSFIVINGGQPSAIKIRVNTKDINDLVKLYWGDAVKGTGIIMENGDLELKDIQKAA